MRVSVNDQSQIQTIFQRHSNNPHFWTSSNFRSNLFYSFGRLSCDQILFLSRLIDGETLQLVESVGPRPDLLDCWVRIG
jgi:hypothetical protein